MKHRSDLSVFFGALFLAALAGGCGTPLPEAEQSWRDQFEANLERMGKHNWIVIAEAAYTSRYATGTRTVATGKSLPSVLDSVLSEISDSKHVSATAWISSELERIPDRDAPGITQFHKDIRRLLNTSKVEIKVVPEKEIVKKVEADAGTCNVLFLKSSSPLPYSSVYLQLDCRYWDEAREKRLRDALRSAE